MTGKELREKRAPLSKLILDMAKKVADEKRAFTAGEEDWWDKANTEYDGLTAEIERTERVERGEKLVAEQRAAADGGKLPGREDYDSRTADIDPDERRTSNQPTDEQRALCLQAWCRSQSGLELEERHEAAVRTCGANIRRTYFDVELYPRYTQARTEFRALSAIIGAAGGYTVPEGFVANLEVALLAYGGMRQAATIIRTAGVGDLPWPTANDTTNEGRQLAENTQVTMTDMTFGALVLHAYKWSSDMIQVPVELLEDSAFNLATTLGEMLGTRIARGQNRAFTTGTGAATPKGVVTAATLGVTAASATAIAWLELVDLEHSVDPEYRRTAGFMFHDNIAKALRKLVDGAGRPLWQVDPNSGQPSNLLGYPYTVNQHMASAITTGLKTVLFGQLSKYIIRDVSTVRLVRLRERYADYDQEGFVAFMRSDGNLLDAGVAPVKYLKQA